LRSAAEIAFRVRQEIANIRLWAQPPEFSLDPEFAPQIPLPDAAEVARALAGSAFAQQVVALAAEIRSHRFPIFGSTLDTGPEIRWRRDYRSGIETPLDYFRFVPYLDAARAGDHKLIWELNRHQHLVVLAQAYLFTGDGGNLSEICNQLESWLDQNPFARGINWASGLEVAFRALSWIWIHHLAGKKIPANLRTRWLGELFRHGCFLENNLSIYFSPNTHLLGEALVLHALGLFFAGTARAANWEQLGARIMREQMERQVREDGSHVEQSTYYHVYALDMFQLHAILAKPGHAYREKLGRMADYLYALAGPLRKLAFIGDDDGGRLFHPYGCREEFVRATLATAGFTCRAHDLHSQKHWWLGCQAAGQRPAADSSRFFPGARVAVMISGQNQVIVNAGAFGHRGAGHSHAGALSIVIRAGEEEILIDPGTYSYTAEPEWRDWFRSTEAHNTVRIDGMNQGTAAGPFRWKNRPEVRVVSWTSSADMDLLEAECGYSGFTHRRRIEFRKPGLLLVVDKVFGPPGEHDVEQLWHLGSAEGRDRFSLPEGVDRLWRKATESAAARAA